jgi:hypothetical protein
MLRAVKLLGDQFAMPRQDGVRCDDRGDFFQCLFTELLTDLGQRSALGIIELKPTFDLVA